MAAGRVVNVNTWTYRGFGDQGGTNLASGCRSLSGQFLLNLSIWSVIHSFSSSSGPKAQAARTGFSIPYSDSHDGTLQPKSCPAKPRRHCRHGPVCVRPASAMNQGGGGRIRLRHSACPGEKPPMHGRCSQSPAN